MGKKILFVTLEYPPQRGGVATYYGGMVEELKRQGHDVRVLSGKLLSNWIWPHWLLLVFKLRKIYKEYKPDAVIVGQVLPLGTVAFLLRKKCPYIVCTHGFDIAKQGKKLRKRLLIGKILRNARAVIGNSEFTKNIAKSYLVSENKIVVAYPCPGIFSHQNLGEGGRSLATTMERITTEWGLSGKRIIVSVGRLVPRKGFDKMLEALPFIVQAFPNALYVIAGDGPMRAQIMQKVYDLKLQGAVRLVGAVDQKILAALYSLSEIFVMPSRQIKDDVEGFGIVFLEAALFGKPSVGGASGGIPEAIVDGKTGILTDPIDSRAIAQAVIRLLQDNALRNELGRAAHDRAVGEFIWSRQIQNILKII